MIGLRVLLVIPLLVVLMNILAVKAASERVCYQPPVTGECRAAIRRYYFNPTVGRCLVFIYGGCGGNSNNFVTLRACVARCGGK
ncbi:PREDICTED: kunitz-type serine protease inhibitor HCRG2-like [Rhagoletis zephyria]|uniref:kunitz-type serine protease inhibitor HCRG2-like n=1 Tax=Rhagoletis zephyria TaxID=28612 RepID=UPI00081163F1|nr:PREDICTED: kunitz-type serine protease inhibitor HCRG2-like [Rhagoletis zephyria]